MQNQGIIKQLWEADSQKIISEIPEFFFKFLKAFFTSRFFNNFIFFAKYFSIILSVVLFLSIILLIIASKKFEEIRKFWWKNINIIPKTRYQIKWAAIERRLAAKQEAEYKLAVIEADKIIDNVLFLIGYKGNTLGDKLKKMNVGQLVCLNDIWEAHKLRNRIVHYPDERVTINEAVDAAGKFKKALEELSVL